MATRPTTITGPNGQPMVWKPETYNEDNFNYLGPSSGFPTLDAAQQADFESDRGSYVPASNAFPNGKIPKWFLAAMILGPAAYAGGSALFSAAGGAGAGTVPAGVGGGGATGGAGTIGTLAKLGTLGQVLSNYSAGAGQGREREANLNLGQDTLRQRQTEAERQDALDRAKLLLDQRTTGQNLETQARRQAAWGQWMKQGPTPINIPENMRSRAGNFTPTDWSGFSPLGDEALRSAQQRLTSGSDKQFPTLPPIPSKPLTPQPNESTTDRILRIAGLLTGTAGAFSNYRPPTNTGRG